MVTPVPMVPYIIALSGVTKDFAFFLKSVSLMYFFNLLGVGITIARLIFLNP